MSPDAIDEPLRKQAWDYFQMHSGQRLTTFNFFYIVISSVITTALFSTFQKDYQVPQLGIALGLLLSFFSFVFWMVDHRNKQLIKGAESALMFFESLSGLADTGSEPHITKIFLREEYETKAMRGHRSVAPWKRHYSYSDSFNLVFLAFGAVGVLGVIVTASRVL
jgi:hypothetical protein